MCSISIFGHTPSSPSPDPSCLAGIVALAALAALVPNFWLFYFPDVGVPLTLAEALLLLVGFGVGLSASLFTVGVEGLGVAGDSCFAIEGFGAGGGT